MAARKGREDCPAAKTAGNGGYSGLGLLEYLLCLDELEGCEGGGEVVIGGGDCVGVILSSAYFYGGDELGEEIEIGGEGGLPGSRTVGNGEEEGDAVGYGDDCGEGICVVDAGESPSHHVEHVAATDVGYGDISGVMLGDVGHEFLEDVGCDALPGVGDDGCLRA